MDEKTRIDKALLKQCAIENFWYQVLQRLVDIIFTLASENLAFRGRREVREEVDVLGCDNFLALVQLVGRYDTVMKDVLAKRKGSVHYLSPTIQNELISLLGNGLRQHLMQEIQSAPFFTVIGDSTKDIAKVEQYSNYYRYVHFDPETSTASVKKMFLGFIAGKNQSAEGVTDMILNNIAEAGLDISKYRGQGYDGASVMSGIYSSVQERIKEHSPNAVYVHCVCHRLNLVLHDAADCCAGMKTFFGTVEEVLSIQCTQLGSAASFWI